MYLTGSLLSADKGIAPTGPVEKWAFCLGRKPGLDRLTASIRSSVSASSTQPAENSPVEALSWRSSQAGRPRQAQPGREISRKERKVR